MLDDVGRCLDGLATLSKKITFAQVQKGKARQFDLFWSGGCKCHLRKMETKHPQQNRLFERSQLRLDEGENEDCSYYSMDEFGDEEIKRLLEITKKA